MHDARPQRGGRHDDTKVRGRNHPARRSFLSLAQLTCKLPRAARDRPAGGFRAIISSRPSGPRARPAHTRLREYAARRALGLGWSPSARPGQPRPAAQVVSSRCGAGEDDGRRIDGFHAFSPPMTYCTMDARAARAELTVELKTAPYGR